MFTTVMVTTVMATIIGITIIIMMITQAAMRTHTTIMITTTAPRPGGTPMRRSRRSLPDREDGSGVSPRSSPSVCGRVRERSWYWSSRWRRGCSGGVVATFVMAVGTAITVATIATIAVG